MNYKIKSPIWVSRSVGINELSLDETNTIEILYKTKQGKRLYPHKYSISRLEALQYPLQIVKGTRLRIIPIFHLETRFSKSLFPLNKDEK